MTRSMLIPDKFTVALMLVVALAILFPITGPALPFLDVLVYLAIGFLFFLQKNSDVLI